MDFLRRQGTLSTRDAVYASLKEQILSLSLPPGTPLSENETSQQFQVSRTPVRESFMRLAQEGLVQVLPQRGTFVSLIDTALVEEARFMREHLETAVIELACASFHADAMSRLETNLAKQQESIRQLDESGMFELDEEFHRILFEGCGKSHTWGALSQLTIHLNRSRRLRLADDHNWQHLYEQHLAMADAIRSGNAEGARGLMKLHLSLNIADQAMLKEKYPHYYKD
ncbi:GntR family transcriptional regulator [Paenibacillus soyae]|uniref:GntR family transcriptional regulator n=1 Tax=Paenibacillus soyae TaxID=2969249 RepID=A0A9X2MN26_9BACL|nr:GntR family transcriptional regulator [Paenibacillus soyae]MCR2803325.1 GntR family transcriptional regulator [Paenibacillus soyae]